MLTFPNLISADSQRVAPRPALSVSLGNLLEIQILRLHPPLKFCLSQSEDHLGLRTATLPVMVAPLGLAHASMEQSTKVPKEPGRGLN